MFESLAGKLDSIRGIIIIILTIIVMMIIFVVVFLMTFITNIIIIICAFFESRLPFQISEHLHQNCMVTYGFEPRSIRLRSLSG